MKKLQIPVGISDFTKIREQGYYYVDKTGLISDLLEDIAEVTLITRPRRFGKTMGMSMLANLTSTRTAQLCSRGWRFPETLPCARRGRTNGRCCL